MKAEKDRVEKPTKPGKAEELETEGPLSEKDEVKAAEKRTGELAKKAPKKH